MGRQAQVDAGVRRQVLRRPRPRPPREVGRRADDRHAHVRPDAHGDHVLRHLLAEPHAGVVAFGDDVGQAVVDDDLDLDVGIVRQELRQRRQRTVSAACSVAVIRIVPAGFSRSSLSAASSASISSKRGPRVRSSLSPASVGATLRVVRVRSRSPSRASSPRMVWLRPTATRRAARRPG